MKNDFTYDIYKGKAEGLEKLRPSIHFPSLRLWWWRFTFALLFSLTLFALILSFLDDEILLWFMELVSDDRNFIREAASSLLPVYQLALLFFLVILVAINVQCIRIRELNRHLLEQENLIRGFVERIDEDSYDDFE